MHPETNSQPTRTEYLRMGVSLLSIAAIPFIVWNAINSR
jgi:hypothetical protein